MRKQVQIRWKPFKNQPMDLKYRKLIQKEKE
jgi:hypothetical protein